MNANVLHPSELHEFMFRFGSFIALVRWSLIYILCVYSSFTFFCDFFLSPGQLPEESLTCCMEAL